MTTRRIVQGALYLLVAMACLPAILPAQEMYLELESEPGRQAWPPNCSTWHEISPDFCVLHHQSGMEDNGDGELSPCDFIELDGLRFHVDWVGPTYHLDCDHDGVADMLLEPIDWWEGDPTCQIWHEVWPNFGQQHHVDGWIDGGNGIVDACDFVIIGPITCHILDVRLDINVTGEPTPAEETDWGTVKQKY
jgi:hypothetical protein